MTNTTPDLDDERPSNRELIEYILDSGGSATITEIMSYYEHPSADSWFDDLDDRGLVETNLTNSGVYYVLNDAGMSYLEPDGSDDRDEEEEDEELEDVSMTPDLDDDLETLVLVGCGDAKADETTAARELYTSNYFGLKRQYAEEIGDEWAILSAEYGLLDPDVEIDPYDTTIDDVDFNQWEIDVLGDLPDVSGTRVVLLAGPDYIDELSDDLFMYGADVETPTDGMRIGERMSWLSEHAGDDRDEEDDETEDVSPVIAPRPPSTAPAYVLDGLEKQSPDTLRSIAEYADQLAEYKEAEAERELEKRAADVDGDEIPDEWDADDWEDALDAVDEAPSGATLTTKNIDGRDYYYYQWREGDSIKSEYVAPVTPAGSDN